MQVFRMSDSVELAVFLNRQQGVYLEKSILEKREAGETCWLAFIGKCAWRSQRWQFSPEMNCNIDALRRALEKGFSRNGNLECRFLDVDLLSLLFSRCSEQDARNFCQRLSSEYYVRFCGALPSAGAIAPALFDALFSVNSNVERRVLKVGVSYQQNYLIDVMSHDRDETKGQLLIEAVDQVLLANHNLIDNLDIEEEKE